jgi:uncharacterized membrane protein
MSTRNLILLGTTFVCCLELGVRIIVSSNFNYLFLVWNLFLAWVPYILSTRLLAIRPEFYKNSSIVALFLSWLVFFPNAPYIITDLIHLRSKPPVPLWFDLILLISFVWNGMMLAYFSLRDVHQFLNRFFKEKYTWALVIFIMFLSGYGIYLGRIERWNSWDILTNPMNLVIHIFKTMIEYQLFIQAMSITLVFGIFMSGIYVTLYAFQLKKQ